MAEQINNTPVDGAPPWRQGGAMLSDSKATPVRSLERTSLRRSAETFAQTDDACSCRPENVSRNIWIAEAVEQKLARERTQAPPFVRKRRAHG